ncbi:MAG TPA: hypothetical protein VHA78_00595 [Candidatus Peribacteraceae bacterium]|nr:hypothetical protein [Candidatus Peribacteraceae bacterium]
MKTHFHIHALSTRRYGHTVSWAILLSVAIVCATAALGRAAHNFRAALTDKPDVAVYLLLPKEGLGNTTLLKQNQDDSKRIYLGQTSHGPELITLRRNHTWIVDAIEPLHEGAQTGSGMQATGTPPLH